MGVIEVLGTCGNKILIDPNSIEYCYPVKLLGKEVLNCGLKSGKKILLDEDYTKFSKTILRENIEKD